MLELHDFYDSADYDGHDTGDDCTWLKGKHREKDCRYCRDEMARRLALYRGLGVAREYRLLTQAAHRPVLTGQRRMALPAPVPQSRLLPAPRTDDSALTDPNEEDVTQ